MAATEPSPAPAGIARLLPIALLAVFLGVTFAFTAFDVYNYDIPIYLRKGMWQLEHGVIPTPDRFLFADFKDSIRGKEKWLFQAGIVPVYRALDWAGLILLRMAIVVPAFLLVWLMGRGPDRRGWGWAGLIGLVGLVTAHERFGVRPELPSLLYAAADLYLLTRDRTARDRWIWGVAGIQVLWVNMHSSHPVGLGLAGFACAGAVVRWGLAARGIPWEGVADAAVERAYVARMAKVLGAVLVACLISPAPLHNAAYPFVLAHHLYAKAPWFAEAIYEILPPFHAPETFRTWALAGYRALLAVSCLSFLLNARRVDPFHAVAFAAFLIYSFSMRRNLSYFALIAGPITAWNLSQFAAACVGRGRAWIERAAAATFLAASGWLLLSVWSNQFYQSDRSTRRTGFGLSALAYPVAADRFLAEKGIRGNILANWDAGSWLAFTSFPERMPYIHSEGDYNMDLFDAYRKTMSGRIDYREVAARYEVKAFLLRHTAGDVRPLIRRLRDDRDWVLVHVDPTAAVWLRDEPAHAAVIAECRVSLPAEAEVRRREPRLTGRPEPGMAAPYGLWAALADRGAAFDRAREAFNLGTFYGLLGRVDLEAAQYLQAIDALPGFPEAHNSLGACFAQWGNVAAAERELRRALALKEDHPGAHRNLGLLRLAHARGPEDTAEALAHLERAVRLNPRDIGAILDLARGRTEAKDLEGAAAALEEAVRTDPDDPRPDAILLRLYREGLKDPGRAGVVQRRMEERRGR